MSSVVEARRVLEKKQLEAELKKKQLKQEQLKQEQLKKEGYLLHDAERPQPRKPHTGPKAPSTPKFTKKSISGTKRSHTDPPSRQDAQKTPEEFEKFNAASRRRSKTWQEWAKSQVGIGI